MADSAIVPASEVRSYRQLLVWQKAVDLAVDVCRAAAILQQEHRFELGRELRRSSTSIPSNVAEGFNRHSRKAYRAHVAIALGSAGELDTQLEVTRRLSLLATDVIGDLVERTDNVGRLLQGLWRSLE